MLGKLQKRYDLYVARSVLKDAIDPNDPLYDRLLHDKGEIAELIRLRRECAKFLKSSGEPLNKKSICRQIVADLFPRKDELNFNVQTDFAITAYKQMLEKPVTRYRILSRTPVTADQPAIVLERFLSINNSQYVALEEALVLTWEGWDRLSAFLKVVASGQEVPSQIHAINNRFIPLQGKIFIFGEGFIVEDRTIVIGQGWLPFVENPQSIHLTFFFRLTRNDDTISQFLNQMQENEKNLRFKYTKEMLEALEKVLSMENDHIMKNLQWIDRQIEMIEKNFTWLDENGISTVIALRPWLEQLKKKLARIKFI